jgi:hypothetical protein
MAKNERRVIPDLDSGWIGEPPNASQASSDHGTQTEARG